MTSSANASCETRPAFKPSHALVRRSATLLFAAAMLLTLSETACAQEEVTTGEDTTGAEGEGGASAPSPAPAEASTSQEAVDPAETSAPQEPAAPDTDAPKDADASCEAPTSDEVIAPSPLSPVQSRALWPLSWKKTPGQGFSLGMEEGLWGNSWSQGLRVTIPFTRYLGTTLRGLYLIDMGSDVFTADAGGRIDFFGRSPVMLNVVRLYGGGGVQVLTPAANSSDRNTKVGVGGHFGFEFFHNPYFSYFLEVGGQGGEPSPGATVVAGMMFYPWTR